MLNQCVVDEEDNLLIKLIHSMGRKFQHLETQ